MVFKSSSHYFSENINPIVLELIRTNGVKKEFAENELIFSPGIPILTIRYIAKGLVKLYSVSSGGSEKVLYYLEPGWFCGEGTFLTDTQKTQYRYMVAYQPTTVYEIDKNAYEKLKDNPVFLRALLFSTSAKSSFFRNEIDNLTSMNSKERLENLLLSIVDINSTDTHWLPTKVQFQNKELASIIGTHPVTLSNLISDLCNSQFICVVNKKIYINREIVFPKDK